MTNLVQALVADRARGAFLGALAGDAAGSTLEFIRRLPSADEVSTAMRMVGGGVWRTAPGQCMGQCDGQFAVIGHLAGYPDYDPGRVARRYREWHLSSPFDVGHATFNALGAGDPDEPGLAAAMMSRAQRHNADSKANGSLMRASVLGVWSARVTTADAIAAARQDARLTHPNPACQWAGVAYVVAIRHLVLHPGDASGAIAAAREALPQEEAGEVLGWLRDAGEGRLPACHPMAGFIRIGFTYAFHHLDRQTAYADAIFQTLSGGGDTDTNACIVGGLVGALHGADSIPEVMRNAVLCCDTALGRPRPQWLQTARLESLMKGL